MAIASSMRELTQSITSSRADRAKTVAKLKEETKDSMKGFKTSRGQAGTQLRNDLARDRASRKAAVKKTLEDAQGLIKGFQASRSKEGAQLRQELAQGAAERGSSVSALLESFQSQRQETGRKLQKDLAERRFSRESEVGALIKGAQDLVKELGWSRQEIGKKLRKDLAQDSADRESAVKEMQSEFHKSRALVRADINEARAAWQELTRGKPAMAAAVRVPPLAEAPKAEEEVAEEQISDLRSKLLAAIRDHPEGITLTKVAEGLGVTPIVLGRVSRKLVDEEKIRKEDKTYFPVASE